MYVPKFEDHTGKRFGMIVILGREPEMRPSRSGKRRAYWRYRCDCGTEKSILPSGFVSGQIKDCGCQRVWKSKPRHGHAPYGNMSPTYRNWIAMRDRCRNPNSISYRNYGARGIGIDPRWDVFENFLADMGERPHGLTLDRIDSSKGYGPSNCRWATWKVQGLNRANVRQIMFDGRTQAACEVALQHGINSKAFHRRIGDGWDVFDAATRPLKKISPRRKNRIANAD